MEVNVFPAAIAQHIVKWELMFVRMHSEVKTLSGRPVSVAEFVLLSVHAVC